MNENKTNINWYPGHMAKTKRELKELSNLIDICYEVIDSRCPVSSRLKDMDEVIGNKPRILIATKYDLCDKKITDEILSSFKEPVIKINLQEDNTSKIIEKTKELMNEENEKRQAKGMEKRRARVMVVGVPNVGKSSLINRLVNKKVVNVGNRPGVTKQLNWIRINDEVELLDSPGVLWPKFEDQNQALILAAFSSIKEEILNKEVICEFIIKKLFELYPSKLEERYGITDITDMVEVYDTIGKKRGCLISGGEIDYDRVVDVVIRDFNNNAFGGITLDR
ncbi:MAG: ribosome biogenesis GTPase YlqF [Bacilli bacterium]|nr:ribosome biogenesis GTPase YlqF [Bacilli bacterium]